MKFNEKCFSLGVIENILGKYAELIIRLFVHILNTETSEK
jgi:hypothetical protein